MDGRLIVDSSKLRRITRAGYWLILTLCSVAIGYGQLLQGSIDGNVTDSSQAAVVGAGVVATDPATGLVRNTTSGADGIYSLSGLPPGTYSVSVSAPGFQKYM